MKANVVICLFGLIMLGGCVSRQGAAPPVSSVEFYSASTRQTKVLSDPEYDQMLGQPDSTWVIDDSDLTTAFKGPKPRYGEGPGRIFN